MTILDFFFTHAFWGCACGKFGLDNEVFFKSHFIEGVDTQANYCEEDEGTDLQCASCSVSPPALLSLRNKQPLSVPVCSRQARAPRQFLENRPSTALERVLNAETFLTQFLILFIPCFASSVWLLAAAPFRFASLCIWGLCQGFVSFPKQSAREVRELSWALGDGFLKEIKRLLLPFADASFKMLWLKALRCRYSNLPCATPGIHASVCRVLYCSSLLPLLPKYSFPVLWI